LREQDYRKHAIWTSIAQIDNSLASFTPKAQESVRFSDLKRRVDYLKWVLEQSEPALLSGTELTQASNELNSMPQYLASDAGNWAHLSTIESQFSSIFSRLPYPRVQKIFRSDANNIIEELSRKAESVKDKSQSYLDELQVKHASIVESIAAFDEVVGSVRAKIETLEKQFEAKILTFEAEIGASTTEKIAEITTKYADFQSERAGELRTLTDSFLTELNQAKTSLSIFFLEVSDERKSMSQKHSDLQSELKAAGKHTLDKMEAMYSQAGQTALAGGFVDAAKSEKDLYESNSKFAKGLFLVSSGVLALIWAVLVYLGHNDLREILMRLPISLVLFVPAIYFSSLAGKHRRSAVALQSLGLRIKAFDAYLVGAKEADRQKLRTEMASVFFDSERAVGATGAVSENILGKFVDRVGGIVEKAVEKLAPKSE
jgi:hypothetical protein